jgi:hypothetical protein
MKLKNFDGLTHPSTPKLMSMTVTLNADLSNYHHRETQVLNALDHIDLDEDKFQFMLTGTLRPTQRLNKVLKTVITSTISSTDQTLRSLIRPYAKGWIIRNYFMKQSQNRLHVLMGTFRQFRFYETI